MNSIYFRPDSSLRLECPLGAVYSLFNPIHSIKVTVLLDKEGSAFNRYGVQEIPTNVLINPDGKVAGSLVGWGGESIKDRLQKWVEE